MSISTDPVSAGTSLQPLPQNQKTTQSEADAKAHGALSAASATAVAADARDGGAAKLSSEQTRQSLEEINQMLASMSISVQFQIDPDYKDVIVKVVDQDSGKVVRQIPTEEVVRISKAMDNLKGLLFAQSV
ncbi:flagellar protein FlaG [Polaromonas sp. OV174]|uniref:flagellar protein FlaG n=1 Tax=Polaromonas sp. OV174 TaxID=1855300 RepID=UPI0008E65F82|nr:flagellar protein FlaG [Polaromonas sp. OV174]SFC69895.1 flagellar protein FlaG [Polaromonas sp. OV174]